MPYLDDDGNEINPELIGKPSLCITCTKDDDPNELVLCNLNRMDQSQDEGFECFAYTPKTR